MVDVRRVPTCTGEAIYRFALPEDADDAVVDCLSTFGDLDRPLPTLFKLDERGFVVTGTVGTGEFDLRVKDGTGATPEAPDALRDRLRHHLETCLGESDDR